jgi:uncharacterized membrane protein YqjE
VLALAGARLELATIEFKEEAERRKRLVLLAFVSALFVFAGLLLVACLAVIVFWDSWRVGAVASVTTVYVAIGAWAFLRFRAILHASSHPFAATLAEFRSDLDMLRGRDE